MAQVVLQLKVLGVVSPMDFPYISPPSIAILKKALEMLFLLGALNKVIVKVIVRCTFVIFIMYVHINFYLCSIYHAMDILCYGYIMLWIYYAMDISCYGYIMLWIYYAMDT